MPWPVYSTRLGRSGDAGVSVRYTVPAGHRAVIKSIVAAAVIAAPAQDQLGAAGQLLYIRTFQATPASLVESITAVVYAGETIDCWVEKTDMWLTVSGFLFNDTVLARRDLRSELVEGSPADLYDPAA